MGNRELVSQQLLAMTARMRARERSGVYVVAMAALLRWALWRDEFRQKTMLKALPAPEAT